MIQLSDVAIVVNNEAVGINPNSAGMTEGRGEQKIRPVSVGGGATEQVFANDLESALGMVKFTMPSTIVNVELALSWKTNGNQNVVEITGQNADGTFARTFTQCSLTSDYEVPFGTDADIEIEFHGNAPI